MLLYSPANREIFYMSVELFSSQTITVLLLQQYNKLPWKACEGENNDIIEMRSDGGEESVCLMLWADFFLYSLWKTPRLSFPLVRHGFSWPTRFSWAQEQSTIELAWWDINNSRRIFVRSGRPESVPFRPVYTSAKLASSPHGRVFFCFDKIDGFNGRDLTKNGFWLKISCPFVPPPRCTTPIYSSVIASFHDVVRNCRL